MPFYAVKRGRVPGVYTDWPTCQSQVVQFTGAVYKKFATEEEAEEFAGVGKQSAPASEEDETSTTKTTDTDTTAEHSPEVIEMLRATARTLRATAEQLLKGVDSLSTQIDQLASAGKAGSSAREKLKRTYSDLTAVGGDSSKDAKKAKKAKVDTSGLTDCGFTGSSFADSEGQVVYTDGASFGNGTASAKAGIGVYWGKGSPHNLSVRLTGRQTNNRAEIYAAETAVREAKKRGIKNLILHTDSQFLINGITMWIKKWKKNGWKLSTGGDVINREDFEKLDEAISGINVKWIHVRGHKGNVGNEAADKLANDGARKPAE